MDFLSYIDFGGILLMSAGAMAVGLLIAVVWLIRDNNKIERARNERDYQRFKIEHDAQQARKAENDAYYKRFGR